MTTPHLDSSLENCDNDSLNQFKEKIKETLKKIKEFNSFFSGFVEDQKKTSKELWNWSTRYNILIAGPPCVYPMVQKDELLQEILLKIQDRSSAISKALQTVELKYEDLLQLQKSLEAETYSLNWDSSSNPSIKSSTKHQAMTQYLEVIADILFQIDVSISSMVQYHDSLNLHNCKSFENFMNSFYLSSEFVGLMKVFAINSASLLN